MAKSTKKSAVKKTGPKREGQKKTGPKKQAAKKNAAKRALAPVLSPIAPPPPRAIGASATVLDRLWNVIGAARHHTSICSVSGHLGLSYTSGSAAGMDQRVA